jgi:hypothetical protein
MNDVNKLIWAVELNTPLNIAIPLDTGHPLQPKISVEENKIHEIDRTKASVLVARNRVAKIPQLVESVQEHPALNLFGGPEFVVHLLVAFTDETHFKPSSRMK